MRHTAGAPCDGGVCRTAGAPLVAGGAAVWRRVSVGGAAGQLQPQAPPQQPAARGGAADAVGAPVSATVDSSLTVSACPSGQGAGRLDSAIGRDISKVPSQSRHRYS
jgi:hypothetical protein